MKYLLVIIWIGTIFAACNDISESEGYLESGEIDWEAIGPIKGDKPVVFKNIHVASFKTSDSQGVPRTMFAIEYPDGVEINYPDNFRDHLNIKVIENGKVVEELWIGQTTRKLAAREKTKNYLAIAIKSYQMNNQGMETEFIGEGDFNGKPEWMVRSRVDFSVFDTVAYDGVYNLLFMVPYPEANRDLHAVNVTMIASKNSPINNYADFQNKGVISQIWRTFRYLE